MMSSIRDRVHELLEVVPRPPGYQLPGGATDEQIRGFERRTGLTVPSSLKGWLQTRRALVGPGGTYGIEAREEWLDVERVLSGRPGWLGLGWIPVAGDGTGNHYLVATRSSREPAGVTFFVDCISDPHEPAYVAASDVWHLMFGLLSTEMGEGSWPFDSTTTLKADSSLADHAALGLPWETST